MKPPRQPRAARVSEMQICVGAFELTKRGAARYDWRDPYHFAVGLSWWRFLVAVLCVDLLLNLLFGALYTMRPGSVANVRAGSFLDAFFFSIETLATVGYGVMAPQTLYGHIVASIEILVGMGFTAITTGLLFVRISRPRPRMTFARQCVISRHDGKLTLMVRLANARAANLTNASAQLTALLAERTAEGQMFRRPHELRLERPRLPIFALTWTLLHVIDADSPLAGYDAHRLARETARLFLSVEARDPVLAATVHDMQDYGPDNIMFGMRFADAVSVDESGHITADLTRLHDLEPDSGPEAISDPA